MELCGSMLLAVLFTGLGTVLWTAIIHPERDKVLLEMGRVFFPTVLASWAVLVPSKFWTERRGDSWLRRFVLLLIGGVVGLGCLWLDGGSLDLTYRGRASLASTPTQSGTEASSSGHKGVNLTGEASYFGFYGLAFFAMRWWRMTARRRIHRFSFAPILGAGFWGLVLTLLIYKFTSTSPGLLVLVMTAAIVQLVSPWEQPPAPASKRLRLRYAPAQTDASMRRNCQCVLPTRCVCLLCASSRALFRRQALRPWRSRHRPARKRSSSSKSFRATA
jgi:hypothetical protein